jgi:hypothetical protein
MIDTDQEDDVGVLCAAIAEAHAWPRPPHNFDLDGVGTTRHLIELVSARTGRQRQIRHGASRRNPAEWVKAPITPDPLMGDQPDAGPPRGFDDVHTATEEGALWNPSSN